MDDDNIDALLVIDAVGWPVRFNEWTINTCPSSLRAKADKIYGREEEEELKGLDKLFDYMDKYQKPVIISTHLSETMRSSPIYSKLKEKGVLMYPTPERAVKVLAHLVEYSRYLNHS